MTEPSSDLHVSQSPRDDDFKEIMESTRHGISAANLLAGNRLKLLKEKYLSEKVGTYFVPANSLRKGDKGIELSSTAAAVVLGLLSHVDSASEEFSPERLRPLAQLAANACDGARLREPEERAEIFLLLHSQCHRGFGEPKKDGESKLNEIVKKAITAAADLLTGYSPGKSAEPPYILCYAAALIHQIDSRRVTEKAFATNLTQYEITEISRALDAIARTATREIATIIAHHHARIRVRPDISQLVFWCDLATLRRPSREALLLTQHALHILFGNFYVSDSFGDHIAHGTIETQGVIGHVSDAHILGHIARICDRLLDRNLVYTSVVPALIRFIAHTNSIDSYDIHGASASQGHPPITEIMGEFFLATTALALFDKVLSESAARRMGVPEKETSAFLSKIEYPEPLKSIVEKYVLRPIQTGTWAARRSAYTSMIVYGPPGSAKTTFARKVAFDLGWPILEIGQKDFLAEGRENIEKVANRVFSSLACVKDVVVLFDELEEMILDRLTEADKDSRLMTTAMLPRLNQLHDLKRIVFILATNRPKRLDDAVIRNGRFDVIQYIRPPSSKQRAEAIIRAANEILGSRDDIKKEKREQLLAVIGKCLKLTDWIEDKTKGMSFADIRATMDRLANMLRDEIKIDADLVTTLFKEHTPSDDYEAAVKESEEHTKHDRPRT